MRPAALDWITLAYLICLAGAPTAIVLGFLPYQANLLLGLFPFGPLFIALVLIVLRTTLPASRFDFGLAAGRWASMIALLIVYGHGIFALVFIAKTNLLANNTTMVNFGDWLVLLLPVVVCGTMLYVMGYIFLGKPFGPVRPRPEQRKEKLCN
ncbi:hypothetical protein [Sulfitobacter guttiformis]|uniref:Uncharacterized protein n=1 Tax=Sulfitobacter guttiformis TaxID=74349 RepID=A0A420DU79_9RHOB|nr:hypothetical protein [Sulfitobacter guttiformis]KIN71354.1 hypothetical protein Z949_514 [Sulfitobacter guttiformis KCTC 32187]RKE97802.1 hypothetical protein C8N30_2431 [Sulfitobacter guttiformis]